MRAWQPLVSCGQHVSSRSDLLRIDWEAMRISDGDELYHTTWANVEGSVSVSTPCAATVALLNSTSSAIDGDWLVELRLDDVSSLDRSGLLAEADYLEAVRSGAKGLFGGGDSEEELPYTSYG